MPSRSETNSHLPVVAIVGRPNVGKSTLFNRIVGVRTSIVHDRPGVTRDRLYETADLLGRKFRVVDTGGITPDTETSLHEAMRKQVEVAVEEAAVIVFLVDGRAGFTPADVEVSDWLRRSGKTVLLAVNKLDGPRHDEFLADFWQIGFDQLFSVSAEHGRGVYELIEAVIALLPDDAGAPAAVDESAIAVAVLGRPNIGKSTLVNRLLGEERHVVHDEPGTTMDPVDSVLSVDGRTYVLVDTAGIRRKSRIADTLERSVTLRAIESIERCHVCLLVVDATEGINDQDARLAQLVVERGRALIVLFNKWDLVKQIEDVNAATIEDQIQERLPHASFAPHLFISARTGKGTHRILPVVDQVFAQFNRHLDTHEVNRFLSTVLSTHTPPQRHHRPVRLYYATQNRVRPPTFVFFSNTPEGVVPSYRAFLANRLRQEYGFEGTPLRLHFRKRRKIGEPKADVD